MTNQALIDLANHEVTKTNLAVAAYEKLKGRSVNDFATEKATNWHDLPHLACETAGICVCGRPLNDELHTIKLTEMASQHRAEAIVTEKGI